MSLGCFEDSCSERIKESEEDEKNGNSHTDQHRHKTTCCFRIHSFLIVSHLLVL
jgi:hypothetical protein